MINLVKVNDGMKTQLPIKEYEHCYKLMKDEQSIGFGTINKDKENALFIFISEPLRGNGYGKILFEKLLEETKNIGCREAKITFKKENIPMLKIATDSGGIHISTDGENVKYVIPIQ